MKLIAHRGGSLGAENSIEAMITAARMGADAVECDIRATKDGTLVIYHDEDLSRLTGVHAAVSQITLEEMRGLLAAQGRAVLTFDQLCAGYHEEVPILLHIKLTAPDAAFVERVAASGLPIIAGVLSPALLRLFAERLPRERILAFLPHPEDARSYYDGGAGILRLWEQWLDRITPDQVREVCPDAQVFIMACNLRQEPYAGIPLSSMDGSFESLDRCAALHADGVLLNDLAMALRWRHR